MKILVICLLFCLSLLHGMEARRTDSGAEIKNSSLKLDISNGIITGLHDLVSGKKWSEQERKDLHIPAGLGILINLREFQKFHLRNGWFDNNREIKPGFSLVNYFRPDEQSRFKFKFQNSKVHLTWEGLSNGKTFLGDAKITMTISEGKNGELRIQSQGSSRGGNVYGITTSVTNLDRSAHACLPIYGGRIIRNGRPGMMSMINKNEDMEAPLMILESNDGYALGIWTEDMSLQNYQTYFNRTDLSHAMIFEHLNLLYFENKRKISSPEICLQAFTGDWKSAAAPFRKWFRTTRREELSVRDSIAWTRKIGTILSDELKYYKGHEFAALRHFFPKESMMIMSWNARKPGWDRELPDWTPAPGYVNGVKMAHENGYRTMAYVNICCANYQSPAWIKYGLDNAFLPQQISICNYQNQNISQEEKDNMMNFKVFEGFRKDRLYYGDLLSPQWREFHCRLMQEWKQNTATDANYEDTAGCGQDAGNGIIAGLSGAQGELEQMRRLQKVQPHVPMASEFMTPAVAGAVLWPLRASYNWLFTDTVRENIIHDSRPVTAYIYGVRPWSCGKRGYSDLHRQVQASLGDALGGFGFHLDDYYRSRTIAQIEADYSFRGHIHQRAWLFSNRQLLPYFPSAPYPRNIVCQYQGTDGIYSFYDDGALQEMRSPSGKSVYGRINHAYEAATSLRPENWPFFNEKKIFGLSPARRYPLFVFPPGKNEPVLRADSLPEGVWTDKYFETEEAVYLELSSSGKISEEVPFVFRSSVSFHAVYANGHKVSLSGFKARLPLRLICFRTAPSQNMNHVPQTRLLLSESGIQLGKARKMFFGNFESKQLFRSADCSAMVIPLRVPNTDTSLRLRFQDAGNIYALRHDGSIFRLLINGREIRKFDSLVHPEGRLKEEPGFNLRKTDHKLQDWNISLKPYRGQEILVVLEVDQGKTDSGDKVAFYKAQWIPSQAR